MTFLRSTLLGMGSSLGVMASVIILIVIYPQEWSLPLHIITGVFALLMLIMCVYEFFHFSHQYEPRTRDHVMMILRAIAFSTLPVIAVFALAWCIRIDAFSLPSLMEEKWNLSLDFTTSYTHEPQIESPFIVAALIIGTFFASYGLSMTGPPRVSEKEETEPMPFPRHYAQCDSNVPVDELYDVYDTYETTSVDRFRASLAQTEQFDAIDIPPVDVPEFRPVITRQLSRHQGSTISSRPAPKPQSSQKIETISFAEFLASRDR